MDERLYYHDAYTSRFTAVIVERTLVNGRLAIMLNQSYFYPASGGQPADRGEINGAPVVDVTIRPDDGAALHWLGGGELEGGEGDEVTAVVNWPRRFDHMQQHTGQHILSQAFIRIANAQTIGFHLGDDNVTIDLDADQLTSEQVDRVEQLANQIVWENCPVNIRLVSLEEARKLPLRKLPPAPNDKIRLIDIEDFDLTACGGTHVARTGGVGLIKIVKLERIRGQVRIEFCCGGRALADYGRKNETIHQLMAELTTGQPELATAVARLRTENKEARRAIKKMKTAILRAEADRLLAGGQKRGDATIIAHVVNEDEGIELRHLSNQLTRRAGVVALLGMSGSKTQLLFCRSDDAPGQMNVLLQAALQQLGKGGGGGTAVSAQGGGPAVDDGRLRQTLTRAAQQLIAQLAA